MKTQPHTSAQTELQIFIHDGLYFCQTLHSKETLKHSIGFYTCSNSGQDNRIYLASAFSFETQLLLVSESHKFQLQMISLAQRASFEHVKVKNKYNEES